MMEFRTQANNINDRREPFIVLVTPFSASINNIDAGIPPEAIYVDGYKHGRSHIVIVEYAFYKVRIFGELAGFGENDGLSV